jgi:non-specific serine/threonine protein kinase/serine/threonine-protein kinase
VTEPLRHPDDRLIGSLVGRYRLVRRLGEGGMGAVYLGEREEDFAHRAAVKLLLEGVSNEETVRRFQAEKEALASFRHPSIVGLLDAGVTPAGIPYLVMDYVEGEPLDRYCARHAPGLYDRLRLIVQLLDAIAAAHRRLIVHCDLKPSNVLVTTAGAVQVLDFGIAKMLDPAQYGFAHPVTRTFRPLTPEFASPEQLQGAPITIAADIYAVGVLLYELLTGEHPFEDRILQPVALLEAICFEMPEPLSRRAARLALPPFPANLLAGDLDAIVLKGLSKEPDRRYRDADAFAADLLRHLDGRPVEAQPATWRYRAAKFAHRRPALALAAAAAILAGALGAAGTVREAVRANRARARAQARFADVRKLSNAVLVDFYDRVGKLPGATAAQQLLVSRSVRYLDTLAAESRPDPSLALELAEGFIKLANLQGSPYENNIGQPLEGLATVDKAVRIASAAAGAAHPRASIVLSKARQTRGDVLLTIGRIAEAVDESRAAAGIMDRVVAEHPRDLDALLQAASSHETVADKLGSVGPTGMLDRGAALRELERSLDLYRRAIAVAPDNPRPGRAVVVIQMKLADIGWDADPLRSLAGYEDALRSLEQLPARALDELPNRRLRASLLRRLGESFGELGRHDEAIQTLTADVQVLDSLLSIDPGNERARWDLIIAVNAQGNVEIARGRPQAALPCYTRVLELLAGTATLGQSTQLQLTHGETLVAIGGALTDLGRPVDAAQKTRQGLAILRKLTVGAEGSTQALTRIAEALLTARPAELQDARAALALLEKSLAWHAADPSAALVHARALRKLGRESEALSTAAAALAQLPPPDAKRAYTSVDIRRRIETFLTAR